MVSAVVSVECLRQRKATTNMITTTTMVLMTATSERSMKHPSLISAMRLLLLARHEMGVVEVEVVVAALSGL